MAKYVADMPSDVKTMNDPWQDLVSHCLDLYETYGKSEYRKAKLEEIKEGRKVYEQIEEKTNFPWKDASAVVLPLEAITIDNLEPRIVAGLVGKKPFVQLDPIGMQEKDEPTKIQEEWFNQELEEIIEIEKYCRALTHKLLMEGTVFPVPSYDIEERTCRDFVFNQNGQPVIDPETQKYQTQDITEGAFEGGRLSFLALSDVYVADDVEDWEKAPIIIEKRPSYGDLMRWKEDPKAIGYINKNIGPWLCKEKVGTETMTEDEQSPSQVVAGVEVSGNLKESILCIECCLSYVYRTEDEKDEDVKTWQEERIICLIAKESKVLIRITLLRDLNFQNEHITKRIRLFPEDGRSYGTSWHGKMKGIQNGASKIFNMAVNSGWVTLIPWFFYSEKAGLKSDIELVPGKGVPVDDVQQILFPTINIQPERWIEFLNMFITFWERIGSIGDPQIGRQSEEKRTATEWVGLVQEGNIKHNYMSKTFREEFISVIKTLYDLYYQHMPHNKTYMYHNQQVPLARQAMKRKKRFLLTGSTEMANNMIEAKKREGMYTSLRQDPLVNPMYLVERLVQAYDPDANLKEAINPQINQIIQATLQNPEILQVIQQHLQAKMKIAATLNAGAEEVKKMAGQTGEGGTNPAVGGMGAGPVTQ